jgi:hypothetical protein
MRCRYRQPLKAVRFVGDFLSFNRLNISWADIPCVLENDVGEAAQSTRSTQSVTLYITINITPPDLYSGPPSTTPIEDDDSPVNDSEATIPGRVQAPAPEHLLPLSHHLPVETGNTVPQIQEEVSPSTEIPHFSLDQADEAMDRIIPIDQSNAWERAVRNIKWVMDTLSPIAEVRVILF